MVNNTKKEYKTQLSIFVLRRVIAAFIYRGKADRYYGQYKDSPLLNLSQEHRKGFASRLQELFDKFSAKS